MPSRRTAVVTGVTRGIGRAIAERLLGDGWEVLGIFRSGSVEADDLAAGHGGLELVQADLATQEGVEWVVSATSGRQLYALVNNAGVVEFEDQTRFDRAVWERTFAVNLHAPVQLASALGPRLAHGGGVVNICSTDALRGSYASAAYAASKAALLNATQSLANTLGPRGVRVNAVTPGWIDTEMAEGAASDARELTPLGRLGTPQEVANCVAWLLSDESSFVNGASLVSDGGLSNVDYVLRQESESVGKGQPGE
jgi:3-oxoacyl-[acyl-carrier protein] reductase